MKKFMFSAIAMMAFSVSSMGNTIKDRINNLEDQVFCLDSEIIEEPDFGNCLEFAAILYKGYMGRGFDKETSFENAFEGFEDCMNDFQ